MKKVYMLITICIVFSGIVTAPLFAGLYEDIYSAVEENEKGVRNISYAQFTALKASGEEYVLLDVLSEESYQSGHIPGALNFPVGSIDESTAADMLSKDDNIIVYCGSFLCSASTTAAQKLDELGYTVVDYKGGLKEWQEKGNELVSE
jgi:rhodanese-related sulfurtransferase